MTQYTYDAVPSGIDLGNVTVGIPVQQTFIVKYLPLASNPNATAVTNEVFYIADNGTLARDFVLLSADGLNFFNSITVASLPSNSYVKLWVKVSPTSPFYTQRDYKVYVTGTVNPNFVLPISFRITGTRLCTTNDVRDILGPIGRQKTTVAIAGDEFDNINSWTQVGGTWAASNNRVSVTGLGSLQEGLLIFTSPTVDEYEETVNLTIATGQAGIVFGYVDSDNYYAVMFNPSLSQATLIQKSGGIITTLKTVSLTVNASTTYMVNIVQTSDALLGVYFDANLIFNYQFLTTITGSTGLRAYNTPSVQFFSWYLNTDVYTIDDPTINDHIEDSEQHIYDRTRKLYNQQTFTELYDFRDQPIPEMPYVMARSFNTLPNWTFHKLTGKATLMLQRKPVLNVISLEENVSSDGSSDSWQLRSQGRDSDYVVYPNEGRIVWVNNYPHNGHQNIRITYAAGEPNVPKNVRRYCALLAGEEYLSGFGSSASGILALKEDIRKQIVREEEYIPRATLLGSPGGNLGGNDAIVVV